MLLVPRYRGRRQQAGRTVMCMRLANGAKGVLGAIHEIRVRPAVNVQIDKARGQVAILQIDALTACNRRGANGGDPSALNLDAARQQSVGQDDGAILEGF